MSSRNKVWFFGVSSFLLVVLLCVIVVPDKVAAKIERSVHSAFSENDILDMDYAIDGRDVIFSGDVSVNYNRAAVFNITRRIEGVRNIVDNQTVYVPQPAFGQILIENNQVIFTGGFNRQSNLDRVANLLNDYFGDYEIIVQAQTSNRMIPLQQNLDYEYLFERFKDNEVWFEFSDRQVVLNGRFKSEHDRALAEQKILSQISRRTRFINDIKITGSTQSEQIVFEKKPGQVSITGSLSDEALKAKLKSITKGYFPDHDLKFDITIDNNLKNIDWHNKLVYLVPELDRISEGRFKIYAEEIALEGTVDEYSTKMGIIGRIKESIEESEIIDKLMIEEK